MPELENGNFLQIMNKAREWAFLTRFGYFAQGIFTNFHSRIGRGSDNDLATNQYTHSWLRGVLCQIGVPHSFHDMSLYSGVKLIAMPSREKPRVHILSTTSQTLSEIYYGSTSWFDLVSILYTPNRQPLYRGPANFFDHDPNRISNINHYFEIPFPKIFEQLATNNPFFFSQMIDRILWYPDKSDYDMYRRITSKWDKKMNSHIALAIVRRLPSQIANHSGYYLDAGLGMLKSIGIPNLLMTNTPEDLLDKKSPAGMALIQMASATINTTKAQTPPHTQNSGIIPEDLIDIPISLFEKHRGVPVAHWIRRV